MKSRNLRGVSTDSITPHAVKRLAERKIPLDLVRHVIDTGLPPIIDDVGATFFKSVVKINKRFMNKDVPNRTLGLRVVTSPDGVIRTAYWVSGREEEEWEALAE